MCLVGPLALAHGVCAIQDTGALVNHFTDVIANASHAEYIVVYFAYLDQYYRAMAHRGSFSARGSRATSSHSDFTPRSARNSVRFGDTRMTNDSHMRTTTGDRRGATNQSSKSKTIHARRYVSFRSAHAGRGDKRAKNLRPCQELATLEKSCQLPRVLT